MKKKCLGISNLTSSLASFDLLWELFLSKEDDFKKLNWREAVVFLWWQIVDDKEVTYKNVSHLEKISKEDDFKKLNWREAVVFLDRWKRENN